MQRTITLWAGVCDGSNYVDAALPVTERHRSACKLDREFAIELAKLKATMASDGLNRGDIEALIDHEIAGYLAQRGDHLDELRAWLLQCNRRLH
jgi:hypothetical protein